MATQLERRRERLASGDRPLGWKVGFGAPAALERLGIEGPLVGHLLESNLVETGATVSLAGWTRPVLEPEVAVWIADDGGIAGLGPALELADLEFPPDDADAILAANVYQRHVVLGPRGPSLPADRLAARVFRGDEESRADDVEALTGPLAATVAHVRATLAAAGEQLRAGEIVIGGSVVLPLAVHPGDRVRYVLPPLGEVSVRLAG